MKKKQPTYSGLEQPLGKMYTIKELVKMFGVAPTTIGRWFRLKEHPLRRFKIGKIVRVHEYDLKRFRDMHKF